MCAYWMIRIHRIKAYTGQLGDETVVYWVLLHLRSQAPSASSTALVTTIHPRGASGAAVFGKLLGIGCVA
jgi:hypothetical protein